MNKIHQRLLALSILIASMKLLFPLSQQIYKKAGQLLTLPCPKSSLTESQASDIILGSNFPHHGEHESYNSILDQVGMTISPDGREIYQLTDSGIMISDRISGRERIYNLPYGFPALSWGTDLAYDSQRDLVSVVSFGGEGYFYRFDVQNRRWLDARSLKGIDLQSLTYDPTADRYLAWSESFIDNGSNLWFLSSSGELLFQENLGDRLPGYYQLYDQGNEPNPQVKILVNGHNLTLIARQNPHGVNSQSNHSSITAIWHYNRHEDQINLRYHQGNIQFSD